MTNINALKRREKLLEGFLNSVRIFLMWLVFGGARTFQSQITDRTDV